MTGKAALQQSAGQLVQEGAELQARLRATLDRFAVVQGNANLVEAMVVENVSPSSAYHLEMGGALWAH